MPTRPSGSKKCPQCPRSVPIAVSAGKLIWPSHKPRRGRGPNCPQSGEPYRESQ